VGKPIDSKYLNISTPWTSTGATNAGIPQSYRYIGLTVNIGGVEYWYKNGVANTDLILKIATGGTAANAVTGATNIGYFSGKTGVQVLPITNLPDANYNGNYSSLYNYYYRGTDGNTHIGVSPSDGIFRRGYVKTTPLPVKSWLWNEYTGGGDLLGWILVDGNISQAVGTFQIAYTYYPPSTAYTESGWTTGNIYNNGSDLIISTVLGSLLTGTTLTIGARPYATEVNNVLDFRTIISETPNLVKVWDDETLIHLSGTTGNVLVTASNGLTKTDTNVTLGGTLTGSTIITDGRVVSGRTGIEYAADYSASFTDRSLIDKGYLHTISVLGGERIYKTICKAGHGYSVGCVIGWSGSSYNLPIANGTYDGEVLGILTKCCNADCFELTQAGYVTGLTICGGLCTNCTYFLDATFAGCLTYVEPTVSNYLSKSMLIATSVSSGWVLPYAGYVITSGATDGGALVKNVCLPTISTYSMKNSDFFVGVSGGSTIILPTTPKCGMVVVIADISNTAYTYPITIVGSIVGCSSTSQINTNSGSLSYVYNGTRWNVFAFSPALA
jgi:hypothetical protein